MQLFFFFFYAFWRLQTMCRPDQFSIRKIHTVQNNSYTPLIRMLPKGLTVILLVVKASGFSLGLVLQ